MADRRRMTVANLKDLDVPTADLLDYGTERSRLGHLVEQLVAIREERHMSQRDVAQIIGCSNSTVSRFESERGFASGAWMIPSYAYAVRAWLTLKAKAE
ncbi:MULTISPECIES: helix-turn-helix domain-containing protein [unclassified Luteococcus]|uniref:helix-turn-helix domain-containing protein n=1 Tax=unclassified Luteococcus TaxID=2639923 RepID=UPI00313ECCAB